MKKLFKFLFITFFLLVLALISFFAYLGGFSSVEVKTVQTGGELIIYEEHVGPYYLSGEAMNRIYETLLEEGVQTTRGIGLYYDNPEHVEPDKLRFEAGEILDNISQEKLSELGVKYKLKTIPEGEYLVVTVPYKGTPSILVGLMKAYPAFNKYLDANDLEPILPAQEIYDIPKETITYRLQVSKKS